MQTYPDHGTQSPERDTLPLDDALCQTLAETGGHLLDNPRLTANCLRDCSDGISTNLQIIINNASRDLFAPYQALVDHAPTIGDQDVRRAVFLAAQYLGDRCGVDRQRARVIAVLLAHGTCAYLAKTEAVALPDLDNLWEEARSARQVDFPMSSRSQRGNPAASNQTVTIVPERSDGVPSDPNSPQEGWDGHRQAPLPGAPNVDATRPHPVISGQSYGEMIAREHQLRRARRSRIAAVVTGALLTLLVASFALVRLFFAVISFDGNGADGGRMSRIFARQGSIVNFPENEFTREGYTFIGWSYATDGDVFAREGDQILATESVTLYAIWGAGISFDGNGAGSGTTDPVYPDESGMLTIPDCGFTRSGYTFVAWELASGSGRTEYAPGEHIEAPREPMTLSAVWKPADWSIDDMDVEALDLVTDSGDRTLVLSVTNQSDATINLTATMVFALNGTNVDEQNDTAAAFAPGDHTIFVAYHQGSGSGDGSFSYTLSAEPPSDGLLSLSGRYRLEETSVGLDQVSVKVTNTSNLSLHLLKARCYGVQPGFDETSQGGFALMGGKLEDKELAPGQSTTITFGEAGDGAQWQDLDRTYYLYGFAQN